MSDTRPNILVITTDEQRWDALSLWGSPGYSTPNLDSIGRDGVIFDRSYSPSPVCTPARVSLITGQYSTKHGAWTIGVGPVPALRGPTIGSVLSAAGYHTAIIGKTHFVARSIEDQHVAGLSLDAECPGTDFWSRHSGPYCGFQFVRHHRHHNASGTPSAHYRVWLERKSLNLDDIHRNGRPERGYAGVWQDMRPEWTQNAWITEETIEFIDSHRSSGKPWFVMANYQDPHYPMICPEPFYSDVTMDRVELGGSREGEFDSKPPFYRRFMDGHGWSDSDDEPFSTLYGVPDTQRYDFHSAPEAIRAYIGMCNMVDHFVGNILAWLGDTGQRENTLVIFTSDHGDMLGRHGMWRKGLPAFDDQQRVPGLMHWPAAQRGSIGHSRSHFSLVDIMPTVLEAAGLDAPSGVQGVSQLPVVRGRATIVRDWALVDHIASPTVQQQTFVHDENKLVVYSHAEYGELYDLRRDPDQYENLWDDPTYAGGKARLLQRLVQANMEQTGILPPRIHYA